MKSGSCAIRLLFPAFCSLVLQLAGCRTSATSASTEPVRLGDGRTRATSAFAAVLIAAMDSARVPFSVDPRPLVSHATDVRPETRDDATEEAATRRALLRRMHVAEGDGDRPDACTTVMEPYSPNDLHHGCPATTRHVLSMTSPVPIPVSDSAPASREPMWVTRTILSTISRYGVTLEVHDYTLGHSDSSWTVLRATLVGFVE